MWTGTKSERARAKVLWLVAFVSARFEFVVVPTICPCVSKEENGRFFGCELQSLKDVDSKFNCTCAQRKYPEHLITINAKNCAQYFCSWSLSKLPNDVTRDFGSPIALGVKLQITVATRGEEFRPLHHERQTLFILYDKGVFTCV